MRLERGELVGAGAAVREGGDQRPEALALLAGLDTAEEPPEARTALGDAAIDLRVGPVQLLADLGVGEPLGLQEQRSRFVGLQSAQRFGRAGDAFRALDALLRSALVIIDVGVEVDVVRPLRAGSATCARRVPHCARRRASRRLPSVDRWCPGVADRSPARAGRRHGRRRCTARHGGRRAGARGRAGRRGLPSAPAGRPAASSPRLLLVPCVRALRPTIRCETVPLRGRLTLVGIGGPVLVPQPNRTFVEASTGDAEASPCRGWSRAPTARVVALAHPTVGEMTARPRGAGAVTGGRRW